MRVIPLLLSLLALPSACGDVSDRDDLEDGGAGDGSDDGADDGGAPVEPDSFEPPPEPLALPEDVIAGAADAVRAILASTAFTHSVLIENATTGQLIVESNPDALLKPASNTKLYTTAAAMEILGEDHGLTTRVAATAAPDAEGTVAGDLHILLEHDFTLSSDLYDGPRVPLDRIAQALARLGVARIDGTVRVGGESVFEGNSIGYLDLATERTQTTDAAAAALSAAGITTGGVASSAALELPPEAALLLEHAPITLAVGSSPLNTDSNNEFADVLVRHLGWQVEGESSAAAGTRVVLDWLASIGIVTDGIELRDGSGLSHDNRVSARSTVELLRFMDASPIGGTWSQTLAIAGVRGTLGSRLTGADTAARVFGKTGSLRDTITLSGYLENRHDGQRYRFSILWNQVDDQAQARALADAIVEVVARDLHQAGARPAPPQLGFVRPTGTAGVLDIAWSEVDGADGYLVWLSEDGRTWPRSAARYVRAARFRAGELSAAQPTHVRVSARAASGLESDPSSAYAATATDQGPAILLVDGNDRWSAQPENVLVRNHDFLAGLAAAAAFDPEGARPPVASAHHGAVERGDIDLADHDLVVWAAGEESTETVAITPGERELLAAHLGAGGALVLSGAELVWALADQGDGDEQAFVADVLGAAFVSDDAGTYEVEGAPDTAFAALPLLSFLAPDGMDINFPDVLAPGEGGVELLRYVGGTAGAAAIGHPSGSGRRVVVTGFPIEAVPSAAARAALLEAARLFLE
ncbi:MAG TPA: D-alanyl-D-alanine carboxypeptidase [Kofleriaceae bacterium]|nr:D-alanyl-D-alanine carboxypeptidase [Kofleriaceae bacterium]